jgi:hypothetical protein
MCWHIVFLVCPVAGIPLCKDLPSSGDTHIPHHVADVADCSILVTYALRFARYHLLVLHKKPMTDILRILFFVKS